MSQAEPEPVVYWTPPSDGELVEAWRLEQLLASGYPVYIAELIAARLAVDLHLAVELAAQGCPYETAAAILL